MKPSNSIEHALQRPDTWRGIGQASPTERPLHSVSTAYPRLDAALHLGGWPRAAITELFSRQQGIGELSLLLPCLAALTAERQPIFMINPPCLPYPPALLMAGVQLEQLYLIEARSERQQLWAFTEIMASGHASACLYWSAKPVRQYAALRKLQLAAQQGNCLGFMFRNAVELRQHSPAALRLSLNAEGEQLRVEIHKQRGGQAGQQVLLQRDSRLRSQQLLAVPRHFQQPVENLPLPKTPPQPQPGERRLWH